jgi:Xaa-Pro aminopeptidase
MFAKANEILKGKKLDSVLLRTDGDNIDSNFYYMLQLDKARHISGSMLLRKGRRPIVVASVLEYGEVKKLRGIHAVQYSGNTDIIKKNAGRRVGIDHTYYTLASFARLKKNLPGRKFIDISEDIAALRSVKTREEIKKIASACRIAEEVMEKVPDIAKPGMKEIELAAELEMLAKKSACTPAFQTIVATNKNASVPHHFSGKAKISKGLLLVDFGIAFEGYCSDITRMFNIGKTDEKIDYAYSVIHNAKQAAVKAMKEGTVSSDIFMAASRIIEKELGQKLIHSLGHGLGIDVHDFPEGMSENSNYKLKENMCLTVEPGFYKGIGIRIEDDVVVGKSSSKMLSKAPKEIVEI